MKTNIVAILIAAIALVSLSRCAEEGTFEKAGERSDEIIDNVQSGDPVFKKKGDMEKMGEELDDTFKHESH